MMKTVTLKADETFFSILTQLAGSLKTTKSDLIRKSVLYYKETLEKEQLKQQIQHASRKVREHSRQTAAEWEDALTDNLLNDIEHPTTIILPLSTHLIDDAYPLRFRINSRENLDRVSDAALDQIRAIDNRRILPERIAQLDGEEIEAVDRQVKMVLEVK